MGSVQNSNSSQLGRVNYLFGQGISKSISPLLQKKKTVHDTLELRWSQVLFDSTEQTTKDPKFYGASVTMSHKVSIIPHLQKTMQEVCDTGPCNTISLRESKLCGANIDCIGIREALVQSLHAGVIAEDLRGKPAFVIGSGRTCRSAIYALQRWLGCSKLYLVSRTASKIETLVE